MSQPWSDPAHNVKRDLHETMTAIWNAPIQPWEYVCAGPFTCLYPRPAEHQPGDRWACPSCGTRYVLSRPKRARWWRNWNAPHGHWRLTVRERLRRLR